MILFESQSNTVWYVYRFPYYIKLCIYAVKLVKIIMFHFLLLHYSLYWLLLVCWILNISTCAWSFFFFCFLIYFECKNHIDFFAVACVQIILVFELQIKFYIHIFFYLCLFAFLISVPCVYVIVVFVILFRAIVAVNFISHTFANFQTITPFPLDFFYTYLIEREREKGD